MLARTRIATEFSYLFTRLKGSFNIVMDTIGLLAAWVGIVSFLLATVIVVAFNLITSPLQRWWAKTSPARARRRIDQLAVDLASGRQPDPRYLSDLIHSYGMMILNLIAGVAIVLISIEILDIGPALLAAVLPFNINSKLLTRATGIFLFLSSYLFVFRLCYLAMRIRKLTLPRKAGYLAQAMKELAELRDTFSTQEGSLIKK